MTQEVKSDSFCSSFCGSLYFEDEWYSEAFYVPFSYKIFLNCYYTTCYIIYVNTEKENVGKIKVDSFEKCRLLMDKIIDGIENKKKVIIRKKENGFEYE